ncbi:hypothetical protein HY449_04910 [Candidatus Pacearchaeota archaeon]|nr:hypothetical protein [Candidatus Pacearchaeota archaeon]
MGLRNLSKIFLSAILISFAGISYAEDYKKLKPIANYAVSLFRQDNSKVEISVYDQNPMDEFGWDLEIRLLECPEIKKKFLIEVYDSKKEELFLYDLKEKLIKRIKGGEEIIRFRSENQESERTPYCPKEKDF